MNLALEKQQIIEDIKNCEEEWILKAVKKLLESESKFNALHYSIVQERLEEYNKNIDEGTDLDAFKDELKKEEFNDDLVEIEAKILKAVFTKTDAHFSDLDLHLKEITP